MSARDAFAADFNVPRGTLDKFDAYATMLVDWQSRMNLVGPSTLPTLWERHFADSAQLVGLAPANGDWIDIGAGAGFPGIVVALLSDHPVALVDSVAKKCRFMQAVVDALGLAGQVIVHNARVEALPARPHAIVSARACASLPQIFGWGLRVADRSTQWLLLKGETVAQEIESARETFAFDIDLVASRTDPRGHIVIARDVRRKARRK